MTTNQTIDGVSRRMLTALLCHVSELENRALVDELRALLDAAPHGWKPCSPELLESGVDCATAPRWSAKEWDGHSHWHPAPAAQPQGEPVAYRYKELQQAWESEKPWGLATVAIGLVYLERKELAERGVLVGRERETYLGLTIEPLYAEQPAPDAALCGFYEVTDYPSLVRELVGHVAQLQDAVKRNVKPWEDTFPPTLLPAYVERVNAANAGVHSGIESMRQGLTEREAYICTGCEGVYADQPVTVCDCAPGANSFTKGVIRYLTAMPAIPPIMDIEGGNDE